MLSIRVILSIVCCVGLATCCCSSESKQEDAELEMGPVDEVTGVAEARFEWQRLGGPPLTFFYEPDDSLQVHAVSLAGKLLEVYETTAWSLGLAELRPVEFYCYKDEETFQAHTSRREPFYVGDKFFYGYGPIFGHMISSYILEHLPGGPTKFQFMAEGLVTLFDWSGRNYHDASYRILEAGSLPTLAQLCDNASFANQHRQFRQIAAASFVAFISYEYGGETVMDIYHSDGSFAEVAKEKLGADIAELQRRWEEFLPEHTKIKELERNQQ